MSGWKKRFRDNPDKVRRQNREIVQRLREVVIGLLGSKCARCGFDDPRALQIDHVNGGGTKEIRKIGTYGIMRRIRDNGAEGYQLLCANCNWIKRVENREVRKRRFGHSD